MNILIEHGGYPHLNMGDCSMLKAALERIKERFPNASISIMTTSPERLNKIFPSGKAIPRSGSIVFFSSLFSFTKYTRFLERIFWPVESRLRRNNSNFFKKTAKLKLQLLGKHSKKQDFQQFFDAFYNADIVIAVGGGYINDHFKYDALRILKTLELASDLGKSVFLVGQGLGPVKDNELLKQLSITLNKVDLIGLREDRVAPSMLRSFGLSDEKFMVTGDDAIPLAYSSRPERLGTAIGVNLRVAPYSGIDASIVEKVENALTSVAKKHSLPVLPVPIEHAYFKGAVDPDSTTIKKILRSIDSNSDGGASLDTCDKVIRQVRNCKLVVTGSYHAGVFALAQGIPVIGLAKSDFYADKFLGLSEQFGDGCRVVMLKSNSLEQELVKNLNEFLSNSYDLRPTLLESAQKQIKLGNKMYERVFSIAG